MKTRQYTIRNIPSDVDRVLRTRAKTLSKSFNQVALEALIAGAGQGERPRRDLREIVGSMTEAEARRIDAEVERQRAIDPKMWK